MTESLAHQILDRAITEACLNARYERYILIIPYEQLHEYLKTGYMSTNGNLVVSIEVSLEGEQSDVVGDN